MCVLACERCGELVPAPGGTTVEERRTAERALRCTVCNHGWFVPAPNRVVVRRKPDRRSGDAAADLHRRVTDDSP